MTRPPTRRFAAFVAGAGLLLAACGSDAGPSPTTTAPAADAGSEPGAGGEPVAAEDTPLVMATTTILGDLVSRLAGDQARVEVLMGPGQDPHTFSPSAQQARQLREADLIVANGLGLEASVGDVIESAEQDGTPVLHVAEQLDPLAPGESAAEHEAHGDEEEGHDHQDGDPHVWFDPLRMAEAVGLVADALDEIAPGDWQDRADELAADLRALDEEVASTLSTIPDVCRQLVTNHDNLGYLAARYDLEVIATVLPGTSTGVDPSAQDFAAAVELVRETGVPAVFVETTSATRLAEALAAEVGRDLAVVELYTDALGEPGSGADTYEGLLTTDAQRIAEALADCGAPA